MARREESALERLGALLADLARDDAPELVADALDRARTRAAELLEQAYVDALLEQAGTRGLGRLEAPPRAPAPTEPQPAPEPEPAPEPGPALQPRPEPDPGPPVVADGEGLWVYAVVGERDGEQLPVGMEGVEPGSPTRMVWGDRLGAVVSPVSLAEYGDEHLKQRLSDLEWVEGKARAHEQVVDAAMAQGTAIPMRLCTIFATEQRVREMLAEQAERFAEALERLAGAAEWGVKLLADPDQLGSAARERSERVRELEEQVHGRTEGEAYLALRQLERVVADEAERLGGELADDCHARIAELAEEAATNPIQRREVSGHHGEMLLNGVYLVAHDRVSRLQQAVERFGEDVEALGATVQLTGPWPPYHFVDAPLERTG